MSASAPCDANDIEQLSVAVIGAGAMGAGIAQVAVTHGHRVDLYDSRRGAAATAVDSILASLARNELRGIVAPGTGERAGGLLSVAEDMSDLAGAALAIEAVVEDLEVKRDVFARLEEILNDRAVLTTNTSSISVSAIAAALSRPERFAGLHFFNPAPRMRLVEVVSGLRTDPVLLKWLTAVAERWGKVALGVRSSPGFVVNRVARPFYGESFRLLEERVVDPPILDGLLSDAVGFRMGPCELSDLIGHDVNAAVTRTIYENTFQDPRYRPSLVQRELVDAGLLGQKAGQGFYRYPRADTSPPASVVYADVAKPMIGVALGGETTAAADLVVAPTDGRTGAEREREIGVPVIVYDVMLPSGSGQRRAFAASPRVSDEQVARFCAAAEEAGATPVRVPDRPGLVVARVLGMIINEAFEVEYLGVADRESVDLAMVNGANYPCGPFAWADTLGPSAVLTVLENLQRNYGDPRYRPSMGLRLVAQTG